MFATITDNDFAIGTFVMLSSLLEKNELFNYEFVVFYDELSEKNKRFLTKAYKRITYKQVDKCDYDNIDKSNVVPNLHKAYYSLEVFNLDCDKVIYLDSDLLIVKGIMELVTFDQGIYAVKLSKDKYNVGVMIICKDVLSVWDRDKIIKQNPVGEKTADEAIINKMFKINELPKKYNRTKNSIKKNGKKDARIIHYTGKKPWQELEKKHEFPQNLWWRSYSKHFAKGENVGLKYRNIEGFNMYLNPNDNGISKTLLSKGKRELCFMWLLRKEASGVAYDVGGNIGYTTLSLASRCKKVIAFEPDKRSRKLLVKNIEANNFGNVEVHKEAVSDHCFEDSIYLANKPNLTSMLKTNGKMKKVQCITLDTIAKFADSPTFIKMDIEGAEIAVIKGAKKILENENVKLLIEVHPKFYSKTNDFAETLNDLIEMGYKFKYVISAKGGSETVEKRGYAPLKSFKNYDRKIYGNINPSYAIPWATEIPKNGKKILRAILLEK